MLQLKNSTPFQVNIAVFPDPEGVDTLYTTVKATFCLFPTLQVADEQPPVRLADEYRGEPGSSSLRYAGEVHLCKPSTDVLLCGEAIAPDGRAVSRLDISVAVGPVRKVVRVFGDREWRNGVRSPAISSPAPFERMPLMYERAFGGTSVDPSGDNALFEPRNPVGTGFAGHRQGRGVAGLRLPNLEDPADPISHPTDRPAPAAFGPLAASWDPRRSYAGTYDEHWRKSRMPYLPDDFDARFFNLALPGLICRGFLVGGEPIELTNLAADPLVRFTLPFCQLGHRVRMAGEVHAPPLRLETVLLEPGERRMSLIWRGSLGCDKKALKIEMVELGIERLELGGRRR